MKSTNDWAIEHCHTASMPFPALILTDEQTAGRGRGENTWLADRGSLTFSLVINVDQENLTAESKRLLPLAAGLAIVDTIEQALPVTSLIKWPNDVMIENKKVAGVLIDTIQRGSELAVIGIGVNFANSIPTSQLPEAASLASYAEDTECGIEKITEFLFNLLEQLMLAIRQLSLDRLLIIERVNQKCWLCNKIVQIESGLQTIDGQVLKVDEAGGLVLELSKQAKTGPPNSPGLQMHTIYSGRVMSVRSP